MIYILENDKLRIKISSMGAELQSIRRADDDTEYLWQGDAKYWSGRAINLFPVCGRMFGGKYTYDGNTYEIGIHGFARKTEWKILRQSTDRLTLQLSDTEETYKVYPFRFCTELTYSLDGNEIAVTWVVRNTDDKTLLFSLGGHPGFNVPLLPGETFEDYRIEFDEPCAPRKLLLSDTCFYLNDSEPFPLEDDRIIPLHHSMFDNDGIFLRDTCGGLTLTAGGAHHVHVGFENIPIIGFWHTTRSDAPFICIEPWLGVPAIDGKINALEELPLMQKLPVDGVFRTGFTLQID